MEFILPLLFLVAMVGLFIFIAVESSGNFRNLTKEEKSESNLTQINWKLFKSKVAQNANFKTLFGRTEKKQEKFHHRELMKILLGLDDEKLDELLELYKEEFGKKCRRLCPQNLSQMGIGRSSTDRTDV